MNLQNQTFVAFDTETTGAYPVKWEICEIAAVKFKISEKISEFSSAIRPTGDMNPISQQIHGYSKKSLDDKPYAKQVLSEFLDFSKDCILIAHHAPFDIGFLAYDLERNNLKLPNNKIICTSLLSRKVFVNAKNHKLPTLIEFLNLKKRKLHIALNDALTCMDLAIECFKHIKPLDWDTIEKQMGLKFCWDDFSVSKFKENPELNLLINSITSMSKINFVYNSGSRPGQSRVMLPVGLVRTPFGDFVAGEEKVGEYPIKRFYLKYISNIKKA